MVVTSYRLAGWGLVVLALLATAGCGEQVVVKETVLLQGKVVKSGEPLKVNSAQLGDYARVEAIFVPQDNSHPGYAVKVEPDGSFRLATESGNPLPSGKYRVAVRQWEPYPQNDLLQGKFDQKNSPVMIDIAADTTDLGTIDIDKPNG